MKYNVGKTDKIIQIILALVLLTMGYLYRINLGNWQWLFYLISLALLFTILTGFCWPYKLFGINMCKK